MQNLQQRYEDIFGEIKLILEKLSESSSYEDLLSEEAEITALYQQFCFLKVSTTLNVASTEGTALEHIDNQSTKLNSEMVSLEKFENEKEVAEIILEQAEPREILEEFPPLEEVHSFAEIDLAEHSGEAPISQDNPVTEIKMESDLEGTLLQDISQKLEPMQDSQFSFAMEKEESKTDDDYEARMAEKEAKLKELEEKRRKIVEFSKEKSKTSDTKKAEYERAEKELQDKKFKLAHIKGLKIAKSLFDDDHLEALEQEPSKQDSGSLLKNNVPTDYMEAPKQKPEFKLDLNDRIAFSQHLFSGSQSELNQVVAVLNSFTSLEKAQEFLSDIYYEKDWKKADNYAQRLWTLVENRFL
ncbi:MAG: hypothetical protein L6262_04220 [Weeksellaceae bacterium]|nr:hypothetical protein [Weeksellaceae bacterium]